MTPERKLEYASQMLHAAVHAHLGEPCPFCRQLAREKVLPILEHALSEYAEDVLVDMLRRESRKPDDNADQPKKGNTT